MPHRNRVLPSGDLAALAQRGAWLGNRGCLHDDAGEIVRRETTYRAWITCLLAFKGRRRAILQPGRYTELFFLDEATAFAAGHRPCWECRRADAMRFAAAWACAGLGDARVAAMDARLSADRLDEGRQRLQCMAAADLPDGVMVTLDGADSWLVADRALHRWTPAGYTDVRAVPAGDVAVRTPAAIVATFAAGYRPQWQGTTAG